MTIPSGKLDAALRIVESEGYGGLSEAERMAAAVELVKVQVLREINDELFSMRQVLSAILDKQ